MRIKVYTASTLALALDQVRAELGENAIILTSEPDPETGTVRIAAGLDPLDEGGPEAGGDGFFPEAPSGPSSIDADVRRALMFHGVPRPLIDRLAAAATALMDEGPVLALAGAIDAVFGFVPFSRMRRERPLMLVGPPGVGKTLGVAKLATRLRRAGVAATIITTDTRRAGGVEQLEAFTRILGVNLTAAETAAAASAAVHRAPADRPVLIDTAGINPFDDDELAELDALVAASGAEPVLVTAAGNDPEEALDIAGTLAHLGIRRVMATRLDTARRLGSVLASAFAARAALSEVSASSRVADGPIVINPVSLARLIMPNTVDPVPTPALEEAMP
ncbi:MAG: hypothetical protein EA405_06200 [Rhodospirillales bacterium]|nr:MAG: hypothetical protein EA405_06200 [Rhodospirillales bacterium]